MKFMDLKTKHTHDTRVIVVENNTDKIGFLVDEVAEVMKIPSDSIIPTDSLETSIRAEYLSGVVRLEDRLLLLLNIDELIKQ